MSQVPLIEVKWSLQAPCRGGLESLALACAQRHAMTVLLVGEEQPNHAGPRERAAESGGSRATH